MFAAVGLLGSFLLSCQKELSTETGNIPQSAIGSPIPAPAPLSGSVSGIVVDENDAPVANAAVSVGGSGFVTDAKGFFNTGTLTLDKYFTALEVNKTGYFKALRSFCANATRNYVTIKLIPRTQAGSFSSAAGGTITLGNGTSILFPASAIIDKSNGSAYTGNVKVFCAYIDPTANDIAARVPGSLVGQDGNSMYALSSAGMLAVELESDGGTPLQLAPGKPANVKLGIPASLQALAPATMATWSLDAKGIWQKEGMATKNGSFYEFTASHFSFWNCDIPNSSIYLNVHLADQNNQPITNALVKIRPTTNNLWSSSGGFTDSLGNGTAFVPANEVLNLSVYAGYICGLPGFTQTIGPYTANANIHITATMNPSTQVTVQGTAVDCNGAPIQNGTATIYAGSFDIFHANIVNGSFSKVIFTCTASPTVEVTVKDNLAQLQSNTYNVTITNGVANAGNLVACGISTFEYVTFTLDNTTTTITSSSNPISYARASANGGSTQVLVYDTTVTLKRFSIFASGSGVGTFPIYSFAVSPYSSNAVELPGTIVNFTSYGNIGQYVEGTFSAQFTHQSTGTTVHHASGSFRVKREP